MGGISQISEKITHRDRRPACSRRANQPQPTQRKHQKVVCEQRGNPCSIATAHRLISIHLITHKPHHDSTLNILATGHAAV